ncbi:hypothetical protein CVAR21S_01138 [Corynebacterium variabile]
MHGIGAGRRDLPHGHPVRPHGHQLGGDTCGVLGRDEVASRRIVESGRCLLGQSAQYGERLLVGRVPVGAVGLEESEEPGEGEVGAGFPETGEGVRHHRDASGIFHAAIVRPVPGPPEGKPR